MEKFMPRRPVLYLIDGSSFMYRAFYAIPRLTTSQGIPNNAIYGFISMLMKIIRERKPEGLAVAFDPKGPTHRDAVYKEYKSHRPPMPPELALQVPQIYRAVETLEIPVLLEDGFEADDLIGTYARLASENHWDTMVVSSDKDMFQLVSGEVHVYDPMKDKVYGEEEVREKFGVEPGKVIEVLGLMGDASDNIPGVPGIGEKTALKLVREYGSIENLLAALPEMKQSKPKSSLSLHGEDARLSRKLATIDTHAPAKTPFPALASSAPDLEKLRPFFVEMELFSFLKQLEIRPEADLSPVLLSSPDQVNLFLNKVRACGEIVFEMCREESPETTSDWHGIAFTTAESSPGEPVYYFNKRDPFFKDIKALLEDPSVRKSGHDLKKSILFFRKTGIFLKGLYFDTMIASYLIHSGRNRHGLDDLLMEHLNVHRASVPARSGKRNLPEVEKEDDGHREIRSCRSVLYISRLRRVLSEKLETIGLNGLFHDLEMPLIEVLADMEAAGILLDRELLTRLSGELEQILTRLTENIFRLAGKEFNINSPRQLSEILFDHLKLKPVKKTKTGFSTDEEVLTRLAIQHELPAELLNYRQLAKLKSTYVDVLPRMADKETGRLHTSFNQTVAATGRLSSSDPNLQNIPIRGEWGKRIRQAFIAAPGYFLLSADYNQIELRILAHLSEDRELIEAFRRGEDIHRNTAARIFRVSPETVTSDMRRTAKTINFGIVYGMGPYRLSSDLGIPQKEAKKYIEEYFDSYQGVKLFMEKTVSEAKALGYVTTIFNRRREIPELQSPDASVRSFGERTAINTPVQGSAADVIKKAMISISLRIREEKRNIRMILQIHDELLFEIAEPELEASREIIRTGMEEVVRLSVPLTVDIGTGRNWNEAH